MTQHTLKISAHNESTVLEKLLQVARYRGFAVKGLTMLENNDENTLDIELAVSSTDAIEKLTLQLNKLYDINTITVANTEQLQCHA